MKKVALFVVAALVFSVFAPRAQAQPFADVPTDIFAFDAVAELAAKGIIEGYPDGTFKGDRAMTRYEMAMVVARILARIEAIKIPPPAAAPPPGVTKADLDALQRLVNEFRAELAAQGVRVTAVEEELAAIRARLSNVRITGDLRFRYNVNGTLPSPIGPDGYQNGADSTASAQYRNRLTFTGQVASNVKAVARVGVASGGAGSSQFTFNTAAAQSGFGLVNFSLAYIDFDPLYGLSWRLGRQSYTLAGVGLSGYGLLFDPGDLGNTYADGLLVKGSMAGFDWEVGAWQGGAGATGLFTDQPVAPNAVNNFFTGQVSFSFIPGWTFRVSALSQQRNYNAAANINTSDFGWAVDANGNIIPGVTFGAAYANFNGMVPATTTAKSSNAYTAWVNFDLGALSGMTMFSPKLGIQYKNYGPDATTDSFTPVAATMPALTGATTEVFQENFWNFQGFAVLLGLKFTPDLSGTISFESGNTKVASTGYGSTAAGVPPPGVVAAGAQVTEWYASLAYALATRTTISANYFRRTVAGSDSVNFYRVQLTYSY